MRRTRETAQTRSQPCLPTHEQPWPVFLPWGSGWHHARSWPAPARPLKIGPRRQATAPTPHDGLSSHAQPAPGRELRPSGLRPGVIRVEWAPHTDTGQRRWAEPTLPGIARPSRRPARPPSVEFVRENHARSVTVAMTEGRDQYPADRRSPLIDERFGVYINEQNRMVR